MGCSLSTIRRAVLIAAVAWAGASAPAAETAGLYQQAKQSLAKGDYDVAIARLDDAVRLEPKQAKYRGLRGVAWLRKGDYAKGAADLKAAVTLNAGDAGLHYQPSSGKKLSAKAAAHGQEQVARMLHDRPAMADFGDQSKFLRDWAARNSPARISPSRSTGIPRRRCIPTPNTSRRATAKTPRFWSRPITRAVRTRASRGSSRSLGRRGLRIAQRKLRPRVCAAQR